MSVSMSCLDELYFLHRCGVRGRTWAFPVSGNLEFLTFWIRLLRGWEVILHAYGPTNFLLLMRRNAMLSSLHRHREQGSLVQDYE